MSLHFDGMRIPRSGCPTNATPSGMNDLALPVVELTTYKVSLYNAYDKNDRFVETFEAYDREDLDKQINRLWSGMRVGGIWKQITLGEGK